MYKYVFEKKTCKFVSYRNDLVVAIAVHAFLHWPFNKTVGMVEDERKSYLL